MSKKYSRIVSLVPSLTELLIDMGLKQQLVGRTRFCIKPADEVGDIPIMGGTKNPRLDKIYESAPDLVIANKEENRKEHIEELKNVTEVDVTDIASIEDALITIHELGLKLGTPGRAKQLINKINSALDQRPEEPSQRAAYFIWKDPYMTVGRNTYIHSVMEHWNLVNVFGDLSRYPKVTFGDIQARQPELLLLSSEPFPFKEKHLSAFENAFPDARILLVDGEWFSWYGSRMASSFQQLNVWRKAIA